jgi:hypothetical protein
VVERTPDKGEVVGSIPTMPTRKEGVTARTISFRKCPSAMEGEKLLVSPPMESEPKRGEAERQRDSAGKASDMGGYLSSQRGLAVNQMAVLPSQVQILPHPIFKESPVVEK